MAYTQRVLCQVRHHIRAGTSQVNRRMRARELSKSSESVKNPPSPLLHSLTTAPNTTKKADAKPPRLLAERWPRNRYSTLKHLLCTSALWPGNSGTLKKNTKQKKLRPFTHSARSAITITTKQQSQRKNASRCRFSRCSNLQ